MAELLILRSRLREVSHSQVRRLPPAAKRQAVGPFLFFDHFPLSVAMRRPHEGR
jgi:hypothetical protein